MWGRSCSPLTYRPIDRVDSATFTCPSKHLPSILSQLYSLPTMWNSRHHSASAPNLHQVANSHHHGSHFKVLTLRIRLAHTLFSEGNQKFGSRIQSAWYSHSEIDWLQLVPICFVGLGERSSDSPQIGKLERKCNKYFQIQRSDLEQNSISSAVWKRPVWVDVMVPLSKRQSWPSLKLFLFQIIFLCNPCSSTMEQGTLIWGSFPHLHFNQKKSTSA